MRVKQRSYPHPVLSTFGDDVVDSQFQMAVGISGTKTSYLIQVAAKTSNAGLATLVKNGKAQYALHLECPLTRYRALFSSTKEEFSFEIPASEIDGPVEVCSFILASKDIPSYTNKGFHPDYKSLAFPVSAGDTLAVYDDQMFLADKTIDPLRQIPSIFVIVPAEAKDAPPIEVDLTSHKVSVRLSKDNYEIYRTLRNDQTLHSTLTALVIIPALIFVIDCVKQAAGSPEGLVQFESRRWFTVLARRLKELGIDPAKEDSFESQASPSLAQALIGKPLTDSLQTLRSYLEITEAD